MAEKQISAGSKVKVQVKYNFIKLLNQEYDVCYLIEQLGKQCPIPAGVCVCGYLLHVYTHCVFSSYMPFSAGPFSISSTFAVPSSVISVSS